jgi:hypothetical protein
VSRRQTPHQKREKSRSRRALDRAIVKAVASMWWNTQEQSVGHCYRIGADSTAELVGLCLARRRHGGPPPSYAPAQSAEPEHMDPASKVEHWVWRAEKAEARVAELEKMKFESNLAVANRETIAALRAGERALQSRVDEAVQHLMAFPMNDFRVQRALEVLRGR